MAENVIKYCICSSKRPPSNKNPSESGCQNLISAQGAYSNKYGKHKKQHHAAQLRLVYAQCLISCASAHQTSRNQILLMGLEFFSALPNKSIIQENHFLSRNTYKIRTKKSI